MTTPDKQPMHADANVPHRTSHLSPATFARWITAAVASINLFVFGMAALSLHQSFAEHENRAEMTTRDVARMLAQDIGRELEKVDVALLAAADEIERQRRHGIDRAALNAYLGRLQERVPEISGLRATDARGIVSYGLGVNPAARLNNSDREYYTRQRDNPDAGLVVSQPVFARIDKRWVIPVSRSTRLANGSFGGVVYANLVLDHLTQIFTSVDVGRDGTVSLYDAEQRLFARVPEPPDSNGVLGVKSPVPGMERLADSGWETGTYIATLATDGVKRRFAAHNTPNYPLYVVVGRSTDEDLASWREQAVKTSVLTTLFFLTTLVSAWLIYRGWRRQTDATRILAREDDKFHTVADFTYDWEIWEGPGHEILYISPSCERITGYSPSEFIADPGLLQSIVHTDDAPMLAAHYHDIAHGDAAALDFRIVRRDGEIRWIAHACQSVFGRDGAFLGRRISNRDMTERKRAENALRRSEESNRGLLQRIRAAVVVHGADTRILRSNRVAQELLGLTEEQMTGKSAIDPAWHFYGDDGHVLLLEEYPVNYVLATKQPLRDAIIGVHRGGGLPDIWALVNADPVMDEQGRVAEVIVTFIDITERRRIEEDLRLNDERFRMAQAIAHVGNWEYNLQTTQFWGSDEAKRIYGFDPAQHDFTTEEVENCIPERERVHQALVDLIEAGKPYYLEFEIRPRNSSDPRVIESIAELQRDEHGQPLKVVGVIRDITKRKRNEEELRRLNRELRAIRDCGNALLRANDEEALLREVCRIICDIAGYRMAWVGYREHDDDRTVRPVAWAGAEDGYLTTVGVTWADTKRGHGPTGTAIRTGASACIQDFTTDPNAAPWREAAAQRGYRSSIALPLKDRNGAVFGALCMYATEPDIFTEGETRLLEDLAGDLAFGIIALRERAEHEKTEAQLLASEQLFRALVENSPDHIARYDRECRRIYVNPAIQKLFSEPVGEVLGRTPADKSPVRDPLAYIEQVKRVVETGAERVTEMPVRHLSGEWRWSHMRFIPEFGRDGKVATVLAIGHDVQDIREREGRFRTLAENFPDFIVRFDHDLRFTYVNPAVEKAFGLPADAIVGKALRDVPWTGAPEQIDVLETLTRRAFAEGTGNEADVRWQMPAGGRFFELRCIPEKDATGNVVTVIAIAHDATERRQAEEQRLVHFRFLEAMNRVNRAIQGTSDLERMMSDALDVVLSVLDCDRAFLMYPCDPDASAWSVPMERTKPEYPGVLQLGLEMPMDPDVAQTLRLLLATDGPVKFGPGTPYPLPPDVSERFGFKCFMSMAIRPKIGKPWQFGIHQCTHARTWTTEEERLFQEIGRRLADGMTVLLAYRDLRASEAELTEAQRLGRIGSWKWEMAPNLITWSEENYQIFGFDPSQPLPSYEKHLESYAPESAARLDTAVKRTIEIGEPYELDLEIADPKPGAARWITARGEAARDAQGRIAGLHGTSQDITARKLAEQRIHELNVELERHVAERTAQLETANRELEAFAYSVSHDLRIPLRAIDGYRGLLEKHIAAALDEQGRRYLKSISNAATRMGTLIDDLLSFSRMGRFEMTIERVEAGRLVQEAIEELGPDAADRNIRWIVPVLPAVVADRAMLRTVFVNLLSNALKFTRTRPLAEIEVGFRQLRNETVFFVRDNGVGFDMQYADKLFGVFQRLHGVDEFEGSGVGLANVRRIIHRHGGRTWAEGKVNEGATIHFTLPRPDVA